MEEYLFTIICQDMLNTQLKIVSSSEICEQATVDKLLCERMEPGIIGQQAQEELDAVKKKIVLASPDIGFWDSMMLCKIDNAAEEAFSEINLQIGFKSDEYYTVLAVYVKSVKEIISKLKANHALTPSIVAKFSVLMSDHSGTTAPLPLLTAYPIDAILNSFVKTPMAINMVSTQFINM